MPSREPELYKDKIEVSLDGRQIFYLFFGGAVIVGLVFVLGVLVGRRVEARGHLDRAEAPAASDPLAALDRLERSDHLSFHSALTGTQAPTDVEKAIGELEKRRTAGRGDKPEPAKAEAAKAEPAKAEAAKVDAAKLDAAPVVRPDSDKRDADKHDADKKPKKRDDGTAGAKPDRDGKKPSGHGEPVTRPEGRGDGKTIATEAHADTAGDMGAKADAKAGDAKVRFTLQLSSFQDRSEAEAFLTSIKSAGFQPYLTEADVTGKGTFYRIRLGSYRTLEAANDAKADYEKAAKKSAQVMRL